jgi:hypothetical protein
MAEPTRARTEPPVGLPAEDEHAPFYAGYVARVAQPDPLRALGEQLPHALELLHGVPEALRGHRYAPGKWSVREVLGHLADAERVFGYRALRFARGDRTPLPGFDENAYVAAGGFEQRGWATLVAELEHLRRANVAFFTDLPADAWWRAGDANGARVTVRALAFILVGHLDHHLAILGERYGVGA